MSDAARSRKVSVVVVNWNGRDLLGPCLDSLGNQDYPELEVVLVDNGSLDGSVDYVRSTFPWVRIVLSRTNLGYAGGCNLGTHHASGYYVLLLNNDTRLAPDLVSILVAVLDNHPTTGAASAVSVEKLEALSAASRHDVTLNLVGKHVKHTVPGITPFYAPGACCMYRRNSLTEPYDSEYFAYDEDVYMSWQLRLRGYDIAVNPRARFEHKTSSTSRRIPNYITFCAERNRWLNLLLFYETATLAKLAPIIAMNILAKVFAGVEGLRFKLRAYKWIMANIARILDKRAKIQGGRVVPDDMITAHMTGRPAELTTRVRRIANVLVMGYLRIVEVPTCETASNVSVREGPPTAGINT